MNGKFFDIEFRSCSDDSDFACKDGEIMNSRVLLQEDEIQPVVEFGLVRGVLKGWHVNPDQFSKKTIIATEPSMEYWNKMGAQLLAQFYNDADLQNLYVAPFYVTAVWKMVTGEYRSPIRPALMIPNSRVPIVATDSDISSKELEFKIAAAVCNLYFRMQAPEALRDWVGKIESLEIWISEPLHSVDTFSGFLPSRNVTTDNYCVALDPETWEAGKEIICTETLKTAWKANEKVKDILDGTEGNLKYYRAGKVALEDVDLARDWRGVSGYSDGQNGGFTFNYFTEAEEKKSLPIVIEGKGEAIDVMTRPLKLSGAGQLKRVSRVYLRGSFNPEGLTMKVYGSRDLLKWWCVGSRKGGTVVSLPAASFRFYKIGITGNLGPGETLQGLSVRMDQ